jgi:hypothetical protein
VYTHQQVQNHKLDREVKKTGLTGKSPLKRQRHVLGCSIIEEEEEYDFDDDNNNLWIGPDFIFETCI